MTINVIGYPTGRTFRVRLPSVHTMFFDTVVVDDEKH